MRADGGGGASGRLQPQQVIAQIRRRHRQQRPAVLCGPAAGNAHHAEELLPRIVRKGFPIADEFAQPPGDVAVLRAGQARQECRMCHVSADYPSGVAT